MILIFINIGLAYDMVTPELFEILVAVAIVTTAAAMPIYRASLPATMDQTSTAATERTEETPSGRRSPEHGLSEEDEDSMTISSTDMPPDRNGDAVSGEKTRDDRG